MAKRGNRAAGEYFGARAGTYDSEARRGIPCYEEMLDEVVYSMPASAGRVLELGCGTGALTLRLAGRYPDAHLVAVDAAPEMIAIAVERLHAAHPAFERRACFIASTFETLDLEPEDYDVVTASMSLHHLADKAPVYRVLRRALRPDGALVFADELTGAVPHVQQLHWDRRHEFATRPGHLDEHEMAAMLRHVEQLDHYETLSRQLALLTEAGFSRVDCVWRSLNYAVFAALP